MLPTEKFCFIKIPLPRRHNAETGSSDPCPLSHASDRAGVFEEDRFTPTISIPSAYVQVLRLQEQKVNELRCLTNETKLTGEQQRTLEDFITVNFEVSANLVHCVCCNLNH